MVSIEIQLHSWFTSFVKLTITFALLLECWRGKGWWFIAIELVGLENESRKVDPFEPVGFIAEFDSGETIAEGLPSSSCIWICVSKENVCWSSMSFKYIGCCEGLVGLVPIVCRLAEDPLGDNNTAPGCAPRGRFTGDCALVGKEDIMFWDIICLLTINFSAM